METLYVSHIKVKTRLVGSGKVILRSERNEVVRGLTGGWELRQEDGSERNT